MARRYVHTLRTLSVDQISCIQVTQEGIEQGAYGVVPSKDNHLLGEEL